jgi:hypothetical protein
MPEFTVKEVRLPELHLPEVKREEIIRALSGIHLPEVDLAKAEPPGRLRGADMNALPWLRRGVSGMDAGKLVAAAVAAARIARPVPKRARWSPFGKSRRGAIGRSRSTIVAVVRPAPRRSRRRIAVVVIALTATAAWLLFRNPAFRARLDRVVADARRRMNDRQSMGTVDVDLETAEPVSGTAAESTPVEPTEIVAVDIAPDPTEAAPESV